MPTLHIIAFSTFNDDHNFAEVLVRDESDTLASCEVDVSTFAIDVDNRLFIDETALEAHIIDAACKALTGYLPAEIRAMPRAIEFFDAT